MSSIMFHTILAKYMQNWRMVQWILMAWASCFLETPARAAESPVSSDLEEAPTSAKARARSQQARGRTSFGILKVSAQVLVMASISAGEATETVEEVYFRARMSVKDGGVVAVVVAIGFQLDGKLNPWLKGLSFGRISKSVGLSQPEISMEAPDILMVHTLVFILAKYTMKTRRYTPIIIKVVKSMQGANQA